VRRRRNTTDAGGPHFYVAPVGAAPAAGGPSVPDLLHETPRAWGDLRGSTELVRFAFEGGDCAGVFDTLIEALPLAPTDLVAESFASQLYLDELIKSAFALRVNDPRMEASTKVLRRVLSTPPASSVDALARQRVLREVLEKPALREDLTRLYLTIRRLRSALEAATADEPNLVRRKVLVLAALQASVNAMAEGFEGATSLLARLRERGAAIRTHEGWDRLTSLVDLEGNVATVDVRLRLGSDGNIRGFGVLAIRENEANDLLPGPFMRFLQRMISFFRGYRYGESDIVVRLLEDVFAPFAEEAVALIAMTGALEVYLAALGFRDLAEEKGLEVCLPTIVDAPTSAADGPTRVLEGLFNPLLFLQGVTPVPCAVPVARHDALVVITGPNSGGKTRLLQSIALTQLLGQVGIFVPASRATLVRARRLSLSLVTDGDAGQVEGRLGTELLRIRQLFEQIEPGSMAILDELCSGTNPMEGEAIFEMVLSLLPRLRPQVFVSTHFLGLAARLEKDRPVESLAFLQVELDEGERPTFQFVKGVAKTSLAHKVAARLGVTREELEELVDAKVAPRP
jgi:DNA mismatch repair protein MutS2